MGKAPGLDRQLAEHVLDGRLTIADAPPELARLTRLLDGARRSPAAAPANEALIAAMVELVDASSNQLTSHRLRRNPVLSKLLTAKAAIAAIVLTTSITGAGAATGSLPDAIQEPMANVAQVVGLDLAGGDDADDTGTDDTGTDDSTDAVDEPDDAEAREHPDNHGKAVSEVARNHSGPGHGKAVSDVARDNRGHANDDTAIDEPHGGKPQKAPKADKPDKAPKADKPAEEDDLDDDGVVAEPDDEDPDGGSSDDDEETAPDDTADTDDTNDTNDTNDTEDTGDSDEG